MIGATRSVHHWDVWEAEENRGGCLPYLSIGYPTLEARNTKLRCALSKTKRAKQGKVFLPTRLAVFDALLVSARKNSKVCLLGGPVKFSTSKAELKGKTRRVVI
jgi:seryl-tRNA(Sec) selenium transferase